MAAGADVKVCGSLGCGLFLAERDDEGNIAHVWAGIVGRDGIEADVWYALRDGLPVRVEHQP